MNWFLKSGMINQEESADINVDLLPHILIDSCQRRQSFQNLIDNRVVFFREGLNQRIDI